MLAILYQILCRRSAHLSRPISMRVLMSTFDKVNRLENHSTRTHHACQTSRINFERGKRALFVVLNLALICVRCVCAAHYHVTFILTDIDKRLNMMFFHEWRRGVIKARLL